MLQEEFDHLLHNYLNGSCTEEERQLIDLWLIKRGANEQIKVDISNEEVLRDHILQQIYDRRNAQALGISAKNDTFPKHVFRSFRKYLLPIAALFFVAILSVLWYWQRSNIEQHIAVQGIIPVVQSTRPTTYKISVAGEDYLIDSLPENQELLIGDAVLIKLTHNTLHYKQASETPEVASILHTISVPAGKELHLLLSDGSNVWLNTESILRFPNKFASDERHLFLSGEGFFDVASNRRHPFIVASEDFSVRATGTEFHIRAYPDEIHKSTTLVEGKVAVSTIHHTNTLRPKQQWAWQKTKKATVREVDVADILANKEGYFVFHNKDIAEIMHEISRWYAIEVKYAGKVSNTKFGGTFSKKRTVDELLDYLSVLGGFSIKRQGREVTIMP